MNSLGPECRQLRQIALDELALCIKLFTLGYRVENPEIGLSVTSAGANPLPATVVGRQVKVV
jgi:hypothetical protein